METGVVKFFNGSKGFGFIVPDSGGEDIFCHVSGLADGVQINEGNKVEYDTEDGRKGVNAINVVIID